MLNKTVILPYSHRAWSEKDSEGFLGGNTRITLRDEKGAVLELSRTTRRNREQRALVQWSDGMLSWCEASHLEIV